MEWKDGCLDLHDGGGYGEEKEEIRKEKSSRSFVLNENFSHKPPAKGVKVTCTY